MSDTFSNLDLESNSSLKDDIVYSFEDYVHLVEPLLNSSATNYLDKHISLRTLVDFALSHSLFMKSLQKREIKFSDLCSIPIYSTSPIKNEVSSSEQITSSLNPVTNILVIKSHLVNFQDQYFGCLRHKIIEACPHLAIAMYLFSRFHITDDYGSIELTNEFAKDPLFHQTLLLKGSKRFQAMSYSQQHKSLSKILKIAGFDSVNYGKFMSSSQYSIESDSLLSRKPASLEINKLPFESLSKMAGFESLSSYDITRDSIEPPEELVKQIFPFIDDDFKSSPNLFGQFGSNFTLSEGFKNLLKSLRRSLIQDMVIIRNKYPENILSQHPIFNSQAFEDFSNLYIQKGIIEKPASRCSSKSSISSFGSPGITPRQNLSKPEFTEPILSNQVQELYQIQTQQDLIIKQLQKQMVFYQEQQSVLQNDIQTFVKNQNDVFQKQSEYLQKLQNTTNGLSILLSSNLPGKLNHINHNLINSSNVLSSLNNNSIQQGLQNTVDLLSKMNNNQQNFVTINNNSNIYNNSPSHVTKTLVFEDQKALERKKVLYRRLSRQATTLYEMWDDYKNLEKDLKEHGISTTERLKIHGSSERQFRHTRMKIIRFVEEEAARRGCSIEQVKDKLHNKMRNRLRPWTLDEVQRMLTSGKRIPLD